MMKKEQKSTCGGCTKKCGSGGCDTPDVSGGCPGESWRCLLKKWHFLGIMALITGLGTKIPDRIIDAAFPPNKDRTEEVPVQQKNFRIIKTLEHLENGRKIVIIEPDNSLTDKDKEKETPPQPIPVSEAQKNQKKPSPPEHTRQ